MTDILTEARSHHQKLVAYINGNIPPVCRVQTTTILGQVIDEIKNLETELERVLQKATDATVHLANNNLAEVETLLYQIRLHANIKAGSE